MNQIDWTFTIDLLLELFLISFQGLSYDPPCFGEGWQRSCWALEPPRRLDVTLATSGDTEKLGFWRYLCPQRHRQELAAHPTTTSLAWKQQRNNSHCLLICGFCVPCSQASLWKHEGWRE